VVQLSFLGPQKSALLAMLRSHIFEMLSPWQSVISPSLVTVLVEVHLSAYRFEILVFANFPLEVIVTHLPLSDIVKKQINDQETLDIIGGNC
jgi:hypothetical protein